MNESAPLPKLKRYRLFWVGPVGLLLTIYGAYRWTVTPHVNADPKKKVIVHGVFPFDRGWDLQIKTSFYTKNPKCDKTARAFGIFPISEVSRETWLEIPVVREEGNRYTFTYYEDYFEPGYCEWEERFVYTHLFKEGKWESGNKAILGLNRQYNQINYECYYQDRLVPGRGKEAREKIVTCFDNLGRDNRLDSNRTDNEVNFVWNSRILYEFYDSTGRIDSIWKEEKDK